MQAPVETYTFYAFFKGFQEGYLTMDTLASFVFGIIIINAIEDELHIMLMNQFIINFTLYNLN